MTTAAEPANGSHAADATTDGSLRWSLDEHALRVENEHYSIEFDLSHGAAISDWRVTDERVKALGHSGAQIFDLLILADRDARPLGTGNIGTRPPRAWTTVDVRADETDNVLTVGIQLASDLEHLHAALWVEFEFNSATTWFCGLRSEGMGRAMNGSLSFPFLRDIVFEDDVSRTRKLMLGRLPIRRDEVQLPVSTLDGAIGIYSTFAPGGALPNSFMDADSDAGIRVDIEPTSFELVPPTAASLAEARYPVTMGAWTTEIVRLEISLGPSAWKQVFEEHRASIRGQLRSEQYERSDQQWYRSAFTQLFANVHSREVYDPVRGGYILDEYIQSARDRFGGVDTVVFWTSYPNLGIDERDQFDLVDDLPGGRSAIRKLFEQARDGGVRPFIAYLPWHTADPDVDHAAEAARLVGDLGADGLFLDSMWNAHPKFRAELDQAGLSHVALLTEYRPQVSPRMEALSLITGSWAQNFPKVMPSLDLLRFELPEHKVFVVDRNARDRRPLTRVAFFSGNGVVLWDRNFGSPGFMYDGANAYSPEDEAFTRRCYSIWKSHLDAFTSPNCEPLVDSLHPDVFVNAFRATGKIVFTLFNAGAETYHGPLLSLDASGLSEAFGTPSPNLRARDAWMDAPAEIASAADGVTLRGSIEGEEIGCVILTEETR